MKLVLLQLLLDCGIMVQAPVSEVEGKQILQGFATGQLKPLLTGSSEHGSWAARTDKIQAIHLVPFPVQQPQGIPGQVYPPGLLRPGASGI